MQTIYFGVPGTGKSFKVDELLKTEGIEQNRIFRTTFHPDYSYVDFVGQILPGIKYNGTNSEITYTFNKGVFTRALEQAYLDKSKDVYLIIEELSRGNVSLIFGDIFQLLDRHQKGVHFGESKYIIRNYEISKDIIQLEDDHVKLPSNFKIIATMNTTDQNVFGIDSAFKRRFDWKYVSTEGNVNINNPNFQLIDTNSINKAFSWVKIYTGLNNFMLKKMNLNEDKQIGQYFIEFNKIHNEEKFKNKLLHYLWYDVDRVTFSQEKIFKDDIKTFQELINKYNANEKYFSEECQKSIEEAP